MSNSNEYKTTSAFFPYILYIFISQSYIEKIYEGLQNILKSSSNFFYIFLLLIIYYLLLLFMIYICLFYYIFLLFSNSIEIKSLVILYADLFIFRSFLFLDNSFPLK